MYKESQHLLENMAEVRDMFILEKLGLRDVLIEQLEGQQRLLEGQKVIATFAEKTQKSITAVLTGLVNVEEGKLPLQPDNGELRGTGAFKRDASQSADAKRTEAGAGASPRSSRQASSSRQKADALAVLWLREHAERLN